MKSLNTIQKLSRLGKVLSRIAFLLSVIGFCGCIIGLLAASLGNGSLLRLGGVTLHGMISGEYGFHIGSVTGLLSGWLIVCAGEAVVAKFAEGYFKNELAAGTPFTFAGAKELLRLGILTLAVPAGCVLAGSIVRGIVAGFMKAEETAAMDSLFHCDASIALGVLFLLGSLLCRCGAELTQRTEPSR